MRSVRDNINVKPRLPSSLFVLSSLLTLAACDRSELRLSASASMGADAVEIKVRTSEGAEVVVTRKDEEVGRATAGAHEFVIEVSREHLRRNENNYFTVQVTLGEASDKQTVDIELPTDPPSELISKHGGRWLLLSPAEPPAELASAAYKTSLELDGERVETNFAGGKAWLNVRTDPDNVVTIADQRLSLEQGEGLVPLDLVGFYSKRPLSEALGSTRAVKLPVRIVAGDKTREAELELDLLLARKAQTSSFVDYLQPIAEGKLPEGHGPAQGSSSLLYYSPATMDGSPTAYGDQSDSLQNADYVALPKIEPERKLKTCKYSGGLTIKRTAADVEMVIYDIRTGEEKRREAFAVNGKCDKSASVLEGTEKLEYTRYPDSEIMRGWVEGVLDELTHGPAASE